MIRSARTSNRLEAAARRLFRPLCVALSVFVFLAVADADGHPAYTAAKWTTAALFAAWFTAGVGAAVTEPKGRS